MAQESSNLPMSVNGQPLSENTAAASTFGPIDAMQIPACECLSGSSVLEATACWFPSQDKSHPRR
jgi:hypothetical protein